MDIEVKNSHISLFLMAIVLILAGFVLFSEVAWWQSNGTTVETNSDKTYHTDTKQTIGTYEAIFSIDWGPNVENDYGHKDDSVHLGLGVYADLMANIAFALCLIVFAGIGFLFFGSTARALENISSTSMTRILAISIALISVSIAVYFMFEYQNINDEIATPCENIEGPCVDIEGFWGSGEWEGTTSARSQDYEESPELINESFDATFKAKWSPGLAWYLFAAVIPLLSLSSAYFTEDNEDFEMVNYLPLLLFLFAFFCILIGYESTTVDDQLFGPFIVVWILVISGLLISSWITYELSNTGDNFYSAEPTISIEYIVPETSSRLLALISIRLIPFIGFLKPLILLPHLIILFFFNLFAGVMMLVGQIYALFGSYPEFVRNIVLTCWMWNWRVATYYFCLSDTYPPFSISTDYPTDIVFDEREGVSRSRLLTLYGSFLGGKFILLLPRIFVLLFYTVIAGILAFLGPIVVLLLGKYPESWTDYIIKTRTQLTRINAYNLCLTEVFPPLFPGDYGDFSEKTSSPNHSNKDLIPQSLRGTPSYFEKPSSTKDNNLDRIIGSNAREEQVMIECPECNAQMQVPKLNKIQDVECKECGLSGEIEI